MNYLENKLVFSQVWQVALHQVHGILNDGQARICYDDIYKKSFLQRRERFQGKSKLHIQDKPANFCFYINLVLTTSKWNKTKIQK